MKFSRDLLELRDKEAKLVKVKRYEEAEKIKMKADLLEEFERNKLEAEVSYWIIFKLYYRCNQYFKRKKLNWDTLNNWHWRPYWSESSVTETNSWSIVSKTHRDLSNVTRTSWMTCWTSRLPRLSALLSIWSKPLEWQSLISCTRQTPPNNLSNKHDYLVPRKGARDLELWAPTDFVYYTFKQF